MNHDSIYEDRDETLRIFGQRAGVPIHEAVYRDEDESGKYASLMLWARGASGKKSIAKGVIDLDVITDPETWKTPAEDLAGVLTTIFENQSTVTILDSRNALRLAHVTMDNLTRHVKAELEWDYNHASEAAFEKGDETQGEAIARVAHATKAIKIDTQAKPSRTTEGVVWILRMEPSLPLLNKQAGVK